MVKSSQDGRRCDLRGASVVRRPRAGIDLGWNTLPEPLMGPQMIIEVHVFLHRPVQLLPIHNQHVIQALSLQASYETLADGIRPWSPDGRLQFLDACAS